MGNDLYAAHFLCVKKILRWTQLSRGDTYRAVYTVKFAGVVYVLHAFQKKAKKGIATPKPDIALIRRRLKRATEDYDKRSRTS